jgi:hypothetical protein
MQRRTLLQLLASAGLSTLARQVRAEEAPLPPVRTITRGPRQHWFGYYDKLQFSADNRYVLGMEVPFEHRSPTPEDTIRIGMVDLRDGDRWIELGETRAWNWQQGCMLQWIPGSANEIVWNDRVRDGTGQRFVCHAMNVETRKLRTLPHPVYALSPDGQSAILPDFWRLNDCRPGYGYCGIPDPQAAVDRPSETGLWRMDLVSGELKLLLSFAQIAAVPYEAGGTPFANDPANAKHWFNHLLYAPDGKRFLFLHRWRDRKSLAGGGASRGGFSTRMFTANADGSELYVVDPLGKTSHFVWRDPQHIAAWAFHPSRGERFYLFRDRTRDVEPIGPDVMTVNGHNTYLPIADNRWILNDTYPDKERLQHPHLFDTAQGTKVPLGHFRSPPEYAGEWRCDTHPRSSRDGTLVCIDSPHTGEGRQMHLIDISGLVRA